MILRLLLALALTLTVWADKPVKTLLDYQKELGLSTAQVQQIRGHLKLFRAQIQEARQKQEPLEAEISKMITEEAPLPLLRDKLTRLSEIQVESRLKDIVIARSISGVLTTEQRKQWKALQARPIRK